MAGKHAAAAKAAPKSKKKIVIIVVVVLVLISVLSRCGKSNETSNADAKLADLVTSCRQSTEKSFPGHNRVEYRPEEKQLVISIWIDDMDYATVFAMVDTTGTRDSWNQLKSDLLGACNSWQDRFDKEGFSDVTVTMFLLNPSNLDNALMAASKGEVYYDALEEYLNR